MSNTNEDRECKLCDVLLNLATLLIGIGIVVFSVDSLRMVFTQVESDEADLSIVTGDVV